MPSLDDEHFIDHADDEVGCHIVEHLAELRVGRIGPSDRPAGRLLPSAATWRASRSLFVKISPFTFTRICSITSALATAKVPASNRDRDDGGSEAMGHGCYNSKETNILHLIEQLAQQGADALEHPAGGAGSSFVGRRIASL